MVQIINHLHLSVCLSVCVCHHSYGHNFGSFSMKLCIVLWGMKTKIEVIGLKIR